MEKITAVILTVLFFTFAAASQVDENQPVLFDEFGRLSNDELNMRLDALAFEISKIPKSRALVRIYGDERNYFYLRGSWIKSVWTANRNNPPEKLLIQFCNINKEPLRTTLFVVRESDKVEVCEEDLSAPVVTTLFSSVSFGVPDFRLVPMEETLIYVDASAQGEYSRYAQDTLKKLLSASPQSRVYLVGYLQTNFETDSEGRVTSRNPRRLDKKPLAKQMLQAAKGNLIKNGFSPAQIKTIDGGYLNDSRTVEYWFVPAGGAIPTPSPDYVPKKRK